MSAKKTSSPKAGTKSTSKTQPGGEPAATPEADFNDTIAANRALPLLNPDSVPTPPKKYKATDSNIRARRLRRFAADHRAEAADALREVGTRDVEADLGKHAPDKARAANLLERMTQSGTLVDRATRLFAYAREMDQIALSDAFLYLEKMNKLLGSALEEEPHLEADYTALKKLFDARSEAIAEGMRAGTSESATPTNDAPADA